jgi:hypothetical protein
MKFFSKNKQPESSVRRNYASSQERSNVFSYHASSRTAQPVRPDVSRRHAAEERIDLGRALRRPGKKAYTILFGGLAVVVLFWVLQLSSNVRVVPFGDDKVRVFLRDTKIYQARAQQLFGASLLNKTKLTVNASGIAKTLQQEFPELKLVLVSLPVVGSQPVLFIQPAQPSFVFVAKNGGTHVLDGSGRALLAGNQVEHLDKLKLPVITDQSGVSVTSGKVVLPSEDVKFIKEVIGQLNAKNMLLSSITLPAAASEMHVRIEGINYYVKFNLRGNAREEAGAFLATKDKLTADNIHPAEYVDVRVPNRAYFK